MTWKGVIISVYVESSSTINSQYRVDQLKRTQANEVKGTTRTRGYDRRAQLLAYAHKLRHDNSTHPQDCTFKQKQKVNSYSYFDVLLKKTCF